MRASDIVNHLAAELPKFADDFTTNIPVGSLVRAGTTATVTTNGNHGLKVGQKVNIKGAQNPIPCSITRNGIVGTLTTTADHDITENAGFDVQIDGANEMEFNGTFNLLSVPNRRTITFEMPDSGATDATGSPLLLNGASPLQSYNGIRQVTSVPTSTTFTYEVEDSTLYTPASGEIMAMGSPRISAAIDFDQLTSEEYTRQMQGDAWLFVVLGDALANKNRNIDTDSTDNLQRGNYFNQRFIQNLSLYVFLPTSRELAGREARDRCEELLKPICQSILWAKFPSLVENNNNPLMFTGHGFQFYNRAYYVHQYAFEATLQFGDSDTYTPSDDVAFRDIDLDQRFNVGTGSITSDIDLDDEPL